MILNMRYAQQRLLGLLLLVSFLYQAQAQSQVFPPHWFKGLKETKLELIIYQPKGFKQEPRLVKGEGVEVLKSELAPNSKYAYLYLDLAEASSNSIELVVGTERINYQLKNPKDYIPQPLDQSDALYLITPDRFANGDNENDELKGFNEKKHGREYPFGRHGGDLQGIIDHLDYIHDLGFTATWSSPLLENNEFKESYHGYAITDHYRIDPRFGSNALYQDYVNRSHEKGMKVIMDVVYNHVGSQHLFHLDPPDSNFFHFKWRDKRSNFRAVTLMDPHASKADKERFEQGWFDDHMPDLNQKDPHVARFLIQNSLWWILEYGIDAFRIDTYAYPDQKFMAELARRIKLERPTFFLFGEIWVHFPEIQSYFAGGNLSNPNESGLDGVTDFQFRYALKESLEQGTSWTGGASKLYYRLAADYLYQDPTKLVTFLDNHDEPRVYGELHEDLNKLKVALGVLYTMRGIPCTYYGTEILMKETENHGVIREDFPGGFPGDKVNKFEDKGLSKEEKEIRSYVRNLLQWRAQSDAIANGGFLHFIPENDLYVYFRKSEMETVMVVVNTNSEESRELDLNRFREVWSIMDTGYDIFTGKQAPMDKLMMSPMSIRIFSR